MADLHILISIRVIMFPYQNTHDNMIIGNEYILKSSIH